jgi:group I intron endonuclease
MKTIGRVYLIISPSNRFYVGSTKRTFEERWWYYYTLNCKAQIRLYNSLVKYGPENHTFHKIWEGDVKDMYKIEAKYGRLFKVLDRKLGLNCSLPKENSNYSCITEETKLRMSIAAKNKPSISDETRKRMSISSKNISLETRLKMSNSSKGRIFSKETKDKISKANKGNKLSEEHKQRLSKINTGNKYSVGRKVSENTKIKISNSKKGVKQSIETINNRAKSNNKSIIQLDINDNFIKEWDSIISASKGLKISSGRISECCTGKAKTTNKFKFKFKQQKQINNN